MHRSFPFLLILVILLPSTPFAQGGKGGQHGMSGESRAVIHELFAAHQEIERSVTLTENGYTARTTSENPAVAKQLQEHVKQMKARLGSGMGVRQWDPAFREFREHYRDMEIRIRSIRNGVAVEVLGKTPEAVAVARNHASIISKFVKNGHDEAHATHPATQ